MRFGTTEIADIIRKHIEEYPLAVQTDQVGHVISSGDGIVTLYGMDKVMAGELIEFPGRENVKGLALNLEYQQVGVALMGAADSVVEGDTAKRTGRVFSIPVGQDIAGRVLDALGNPIDGLGTIKVDEYRPAENKAPGIVDRQPVHQTLHTGLKIIDALLPIGKGQRELIVGDRQTGKTALALDAILNQKGRGVRCIYVAIGQKQSTVAQIVARLRESGALEYTTVVMSTASDPASLQYLAPFSGCAIGEYFMAKGEDVLIVYDDLSKHAVAYRELSLLLRRPPGREAYPGDTFYLHSRLLERAAKMSDKLGGGSLTALPIIETQAGDISTYIPTNLVSITDGQIFLEKGLFNAGNRPAVNVGLSVSRVGGAAQSKAMKQVAGTLRLELAQYRALASFAQFGAELDKSTQLQLNRGARLTEIMKQPQYRPIQEEKQILIIFASTHGYLDSYPIGKIRSYEQELYSFMERRYGNLMAELRLKRILTEEMRNQILQGLDEFKVDFANRSSQADQRPGVGIGVGL